jgi:enoyl-CoA hydratase
MTSSDLALDTVTLERDAHVLVMGLDRPEKRNAFNLAMLADLSRAYALLESDDALRVGVLVAHGEHFTAGLDLVDVGPAIAEGRDPFPVDGRDPWRLDGEWTKPVVAAAQGRCLTLGIELLLAADVRIAAADTGSRTSRSFGASSRSEAPRSGCRGLPAGATRCGGCSPATSSTSPKRTGSG